LDISIAPGDVFPAKVAAKRSYAWASGGSRLCVGAKEREEAFTLDQVGNWKTYLAKADTGGGLATEADQDRAVNDANEITGLTQRTGSWDEPDYDARGDMTTAPLPGSAEQAVSIPSPPVGEGRVRGNGRVFKALHPHPHPLPSREWGLGNGTHPRTPASAVRVPKASRWQNRLVEVADGERVHARYEYDGLNRRVKAHIDSDASGGPGIRTILPVAGRNLRRAGHREGRRAGPPRNSFLS